MAAAYYKRKAFEDSVEAWKKAIAISDAHAMPYYCLAQVLLDMDEPDRALPFALKAVALDNQDPFGYDVLGLAYYRTGMYFEAAEAMIQAVHLTDKKHAFILKHWRQIRNSYIQFKKKEKSSDAQAS
jgi:tetratricopeptide (TPR) repeat protein